MWEKETSFSKWHNSLLCWNFTARLCQTYTTGVEVGFNQSDLYTTEGQSEAINVCVEVTSGSLQRNISVYLETVNEDGGGRFRVMLKLSMKVHSYAWMHAALPGEDYQYVPRKTLTFGPSISVICTPIYILDDDLLESAENITLSLSPSLEDITVVNFSVKQTAVEIFEDSVDGIKSWSNTLHLMYTPTPQHFYQACKSYPLLKLVSHDSTKKDKDYETSLFL